ncbi:hypothetical protein [Vagococcus xieshaowenii]|uniref:DUF2975 domain-containing protein n=1 Tax=Vagococcus xieshaowenii TaxID=2562451 RepID=A0AAJ5JLY7_9ENTE|nr:hypothetical protein [Vagococcus xieshaowenii]QCA29232.1 hypothetical protein E4Z98_07840 [Vagococcus xieshaowenii]TFZ43255.1 hypothetical protein E4031_00605 [Vagococcus xieshaowenii]
MKEVSLKIVDKLLIGIKWLLIILLVLVVCELFYGFIRPANSMVLDASFIKTLYSYKYGWSITPEQIAEFPVAAYNRLTTIELVILLPLIIMTIHNIRLAIHSTLQGRLFTQINVKRFKSILILSILSSLTIMVFNFCADQLLYQYFEAYSDMNSKMSEWIEFIMEPCLLFIFYLLFKKGVALQEEHDLTI